MLEGLVLLCAFGTPPEKCTEKTAIKVLERNDWDLGVPKPCIKYGAAYIAPYKEGYPNRIICGDMPLIKNKK